MGEESFTPSRASLGHRCLGATSWGPWMEPLRGPWPLPPPQPPAPDHSGTVSEERKPPDCQEHVSSSASPASVYFFLPPWIP